MIIETLEDLYIEQLNDVYSANTQTLAFVRELLQAATDKNLSDALSTSLDDIQSGVSAMQLIAHGHDESLECAQCEAMEGLVKIAHAHVLVDEYTADETKDAMIIVQYLRLIHYAIAGFGCLAAFADRLELDHDLDALTACLKVSTNGHIKIRNLAAGRNEWQH